MPEVTIDGISYTPNAAPHIGIGITTRNRADTLATTLQYIRKHTPNAHIVIVDDASTTPVPEADHRFPKQAGIAQSKNKCLELLMQTGCDELFLFDDDCYPIVDNWFQPYIDSPEPHLMYLFEDLTTRKLGDIKQVYRDLEHVAYTGVRGCLLYVTRAVVERIGGMDPIFGVWGYEHVDWSNRIHNAGLTSWRYADVVGSEWMIHSLDEHEAVERAVPAAERQALVAKNAEICNRRRDNGYAEYIEYRQPRNTIITTLFTGVADTQRGTTWKPDPTLLRSWADSITDVSPDTRKVVLHNEEFTFDAAELVQVPCHVPIYFQRWLSIWQWLRDHPETRWVWCTDGTDVEMLKEPWEHMQDDVLYVGSENQVVGCRWMVDNHKAAGLQEFFGDNPARPLLNAGLVGGSRETVMEFLHCMIREYFDHEARLFHEKDAESLGVGDMGVFNFVAWTRFVDRLSFGPHVNTVFKADERNDHSWWKHK